MSNVTGTVGEFELKETGSDFAETATRPKFIVKPTIPIEEVPEELRGHSLTSADIKRIAEAMQQQVVDDDFVPGRTQVLKKSKTPVIDFSSLSQDDIYNMDIPIEARAFMAGDPLKVKLKDSNYEARWVSTQSQRLGYMKSIGFSYVTAEDLEANLETEVSTDAQGHFTIFDVVLMRIQKARYYPALRAAHERAVRTMQATQASQMGMQHASNFMQKTAGGDFGEASQSGQLAFYNPGAK